VSTSEGTTLDFSGTKSTSSKVNASRISIKTPHNLEAPFSLF
jgi:hypothetical protein